MCIRDSPTAKQWCYVTEIPDVAPPSEKYRKRNYWQPEQIHDFLKLIEDDPMLHLAVHIGFVCSLRAGEVAGIDTSLIDLKDKSLWIKRILQRVSDESLATLPREEIIHVFPKKKKTSKSSLILNCLLYTSVRGCSTPAQRWGYSGRYGSSVMTTVIIPPKRARAYTAPYPAPCGKMN